MARDCCSQLKALVVTCHFIDNMAFDHWRHWLATAVMYHSELREVHRKITNEGDSCSAGKDKNWDGQNWVYVRLTQTTLGSCLQRNELLGNSDRNRVRQFQFPHPYSWIWYNSILLPYCDYSWLCHNKIKVIALHYLVLLLILENNN